MKNRLMTIAAAALLVATTASCEKTIDQELSGNERTLLELRIEGQMGKAITERDGDRATATVYILDQDDYDYAHVPVPERRARIRVTSASGHVLDWWIYLETYDPFYLGTWRIIDVKLACDQRVSGVGDGSWTTQLSGSEFGDYGLPEYDDRVTITLGEITDNALTGTLVHSAGDPRLRHLLPPGESQWTLDLTTNQMKITQNNVTSTMIFGEEGDNTLFRFILPDASSEPSRDNFYDNMWRSSTELFYVMYKISE